MRLDRLFELPRESDATASGATAPAAARLAFRVRGAVQGVGMRPFVHGLAARFALSGFVLNDGDGVAIEVEGPEPALSGFRAALTAEKPPLARFDAIETRALAPLGETGFRIVESVAGKVTTRVPADAATCPACLADLFDPASRFHLYPFVNCTHCGPRYTITARLPYDRPQTAMAGFPMCPDCARDYRDPRNRRFHAEPIACPVCGPKLDRPIDEVVAAIRAGKIVALKGLGGFHLMCDARNEEVVAELRRRKRRDAKPFAVMVANLASLDGVVRANDAERPLVASSAAPIVVMDAVEGAVAASVAPNLGRLGVMIAATPLHHLLFWEAAGRPAGKQNLEAANEFVIVATSANPGGEPLVIDDADARRRLDGIADLIVGHDRPIVIRADDSVCQVIAGVPTFIRRARGYVPEPIDLGVDGPNVLATGAFLKATVCVTRGREAFVSQHVGDLDTTETVKFYRETAGHLLDLLDVRPEAVACDLHPDFFSSRFAAEAPVDVLPVQHHAAHVAAIAAEHGVVGPILGLALDGIGHGDDGSAWGGEAIRVDGAGWERLGHLAPLALPGGDKAAREPWRMALAALHAIGDPLAVKGQVSHSLETAKIPFPARALVDPVAARIASGREAATTSAGRLFDAAAGLLGVRMIQDHEGQAAMELEALVGEAILGTGLHSIVDGVLDFAPLLGELARPGLDPRFGAELFHGALIDGFSAWVGGFARAGEAIALGGGCLMNRVLAEGLVDRLTAAGFRPLLARAVPPGDGGLSLGQAAIARAHLHRNQERIP
ncbi:MAG: carbamoyltransferase HypF [Phyllobacteriaceae bacterium]|nr:carbamoyltransferase HypF [Phyllobacteriaceae bacterium]